jgi:predicted Zn-dependent peptidase
LLHEAAYGETAPLGGSLFAQNVDRLSYKEVLDYRQKHFVADNIVVTASGISHEKLTSLVEQHIIGGKLNSKASVHTDIELEVGQIRVAATPTASLSAASPYIGGEVKLRQDLGGESHIGLAFPVPVGDAVKPFLVLNALLAQKFGEHNVFLNSYSRGGISGYYSSGDAVALGAKLEAVITEIKAIASGGVDVSAAKTKVGQHSFHTCLFTNTFTGVCSSFPCP